MIQKGTTNGTTTDLDGQFSIEVPANATLLISFIGYIPQDIAVKGQSVINVTLKEDSQALEEVVVVGYGTMKKKDLTGAVASVKMDDAPVGTVSTISHALAGKAAGLQVSTISAQPGGQSTFRIRGAASSDKAGNDPLIIIDGFPVSDPGSLDSGNQYKDGNKDNILSSINPNDIESIEVLKDASSTAIYGARAGNGVIIVTTVLHLFKIFQSLMKCWMLQALCKRQTITEKSFGCVRMVWAFMVVNPNQKCLHLLFRIILLNKLPILHITQIGLTKSPDWDFKLHIIYPLPAVMRIRSIWFPVTISNKTV